MKLPIILGSIVVAVILIFSAAYKLDEGIQAIITQFGRVVGEPVTKAGLHWKLPFVQDVRYFEKRILAWDGDPEQIPTADGKFIRVDTTARWRIIDAKKFAETLRTEQGAQNRLDSILDGATRDIVSRHKLVEAVRNTNTILEAKKPTKEEEKVIEEEAKGVGETVNVEKVVEMEEAETGQLESVSVGREQLSQMILDRARKKAEPLGVELIDVQLRWIAYEKTVEAKVYERMISERKRIAEKIRSIGKGEQAKIMGTLNRDLKEIQSTAYRKSQAIRGKAEAESIAIYARSLKQSPSFYEFSRTLEAYRNTLPEKGNFILSTDSEFLTLMKKR